MARWEYFIYSKSDKYSPEDIAKSLIKKGYEESLTCKTVTKQDVIVDKFEFLGSEFEANINISKGTEGLMFSTRAGDEETVKKLFNVFQRRDIDVVMTAKLSALDYKSYFEDAMLEVDGKTFFSELKSEKEMMSQSHTPGKHFENQEEFDSRTKFNDVRYHFLNCTFDDIHFSDGVVIGQLEKCRFNRCTFENFDAENISFKNSVLTDCRIINSNFQNCNFENAGLYHSQISKSNFTNANLAVASIKDTRFDSDNMSGVKFHGSTLDGVVITDATVDKPVEGLYAENITMGGATHQEVEASKNRIFSELKLEPVSFEQIAEQAKASLEPLPEVQQHNIKFMWNGIKIDGTLYKGSYYTGTYATTSNLPEGTITVHLDRSNTPRVEGLEIENHSDSMSDYFETDTVRVRPGTEHYDSAIKAAKAYEIHQEKLAIKQYEKSLSKHIGHPLEDYYRQELERHKNALEKLQNSQTHLEKANNNLSFSNEHTQLQFEIVSKYNPAPNTFQTWIRSADDIKSFEDALKDSDYVGWEQNGFDESYPSKVAQEALNSGKITVYSSHPIEQGVFVTPSAMEAQSYSGNGKIYSKEVNLNAVAWIDPTQGQYANVEEYVARIAEEPGTTKIFESSVPIELSNVPHMTLDEFLATRGLASPVDDFMIDKLKLPHGQSKYDERKMHENARKSSREYHDKRNAAIKEYQEKVADGEIIEPSVEERYIKKAMGNPDKQSVQAARRVLEKRGYIQNENGEWIKPPEAQIQEAEPTLAEQKIAEVKEKLNNPQTATKSLTNEEFDILKGEIVDIAKNYQADPKLAAELFAFKTQFYQYSLNNTLLIHLQNPHATFVASFTKWKSMGYSIKKGAKHMKISRPIEIAKFPRDVNGKTKMIDVKNASTEEKAKIANGEIKVEKVTKFVPHRVFDISQTTCPPEDYPKIYSMGVPDIEKAQLYECIAEYAKDCGFSVTEEDLSSISLNGYYRPSDDSIHINSLLQDSKKLETMAHELAHGVLHKTTTQPTEIAEFEAESFGTMLKRKLGFPVSEESKRYIKNYFSDSKFVTKGKFNMDETLSRLSKAFKHTSTGIDKKIEEMGYGSPREQGRSLSQAKAQAVDPVKISSNFTQAL